MSEVKQQFTCGKIGTMEVDSKQLHEYLYHYFGFDTFKEKQEEIIQSILIGQDTFVIMPTGGGKSLCYQLPALMLEGTAIIISPLIALMKNQVDSIRGYSQQDNIAHFLNSSLNRTEMRKVKEDIVSGETKLLFIAPETLTKDENIDFFKKVNVSFVAVDEAHCISEWGHDFRPEYRRIKTMIDTIKATIPVIALTATATPKVRVDIIKNLHLKNVAEFITSFNRTNLFYEVRPKLKKDQTFKQIVQIIKKDPGQSGIIYVQARKTTEEIAKVLQVNGIRAAAYHAGLDAKTRAKVQDGFLMEDIDVICATIAFGMGIDKPDVRFVIHYDIPKSIENYYQETGRAGRDGILSSCFSFYSYKDVLRLEKFLRDKPISERLLGAQLLEEIIAYAETSACRRQFLLHYFGEEYKESKCGNLCDNCRTPKEKIEVKDEMLIALQVIETLHEKHGIKLLVDFVLGRSTQESSDFQFGKKKNFGIGKEKEEVFWHSIYRQALLKNLIYKDIEQYGLLKLTPEGREFLINPTEVSITVNHNYDQLASDDAFVTSQKGGSALDTNLVKILKEIRLSVAKQHKVKPWVVFFDPSLEEMATYYPTSIDSLTKISGVSRGKAQRYGEQFVEFIKEYVEENDIIRAEDFVVKQVANKSKMKVSIIQNIDKKIPLDDIASINKISMEDLLDELNIIVNSGTKIDLDYYLEENVDEYVQEDIYEYFMEAESDSIEDAYRELKDDDITREEVQLMRVKFLSNIAN